MNGNRRERRRRMTRIDGSLYEGEWKVISGTSAVPSGRIRIRAEKGDEFALEYQVEKGWALLQIMVYMPDTETLENRVDASGQPLPGEPERRISVWNRLVRNRSECCSIYAMRVGANPSHLLGLPDFEQGPNGSWGAEEG